MSIAGRMKIEPGSRRKVRCVTLSGVLRGEPARCDVLNRPLPSRGVRSAPLFPNWPDCTRLRPIPWTLRANPPRHFASASVLLRRTFPMTCATSSALPRAKSRLRVNLAKDGIFLKYGSESEWGAFSETGGRLLTLLKLGRLRPVGRTSWPHPDKTRRSGIPETLRPKRIGVLSRRSALAGGFFGALALRAFPGVIERDRADARQPSLGGWVLKPEDF